MSSYVLNCSGPYSIVAPSFSLDAPLAISSGGTGSGSASGALSNLGDQPLSQYLSDISSSTPSSGQYIQYNGSNYVAGSAPTYSAGSGLSLSGSTFAASVDGSSLDVNSGSQIEIMAGGVSSSKLASGAVSSGKFDSSAVADGLQLSAGAIAVDGSVVRTSGAFSLGGSITFSATEKQQVSGQQSYSQYDNFELLTTDGSSQTLFSVNPSAGACTFFHVDIAVCSNDLSVCGQFSVECVVVNNAGTVTALQLNASTSIYAYSGLAASLSVVGSNVVCSVVGVAKNLRWLGSLKQCVAPASS